MIEKYWTFFLVVVDYLMSEIESFIYKSNLPKFIKDFYILKSLMLSAKLKARYERNGISQ